MVRTYQRTTNRGRDNNWSATSLSDALAEIRSGQLKASVASRAYNIPETTLRRYLKLPDEKFPVNGGRFRRVFSDTLEKQLCDYLLEMSSRGFGMTQQQVCSFAYELAEKNNIEHNFDMILKRAGRDWFDGFVRRHRNLSIRSPEATSLGRLMGFNRPQVSKFFDVLATVYGKYSFSPSRIYNCDESGLPTVPTKLPKVIAGKGVKRVAKVTSAERGKNVTFVCCMNAAGAFLPPAFLFARKKMTERLMIGAPADAKGIVTDSGWMTSEAFVKYLQHVVAHARPSVEDPILMILDNHASHIALQAVEFCRENGIMMVSIPPHCSHRLQPLDVSFFGALKTYYSRACDAWMAHHPGQAITEFHVASLVNGAYQKAASVASAVNGFRASGIYPFDRDVFSEADFSAALTTERAVETNPPTVSAATPVAANQETDSTDQVSSPVAINQETNEGVTVSTDQVSSSIVTPEQVRPYPAAQRSSAVKKRAVVRAQLLTASPYRQQLLDQQEAKRNGKRRAKPHASRQLPKKRLNFLPADTNTVDNTPCLFCEIPYSESGVPWFRCKNCTSWVCETCAGRAAKQKKVFTCSNCK